MQNIIASFHKLQTLLMVTIITSLSLVMQEVMTRHPSCQEYISFCELQTLHAPATTAAVLVGRWRPLAVSHQHLYIVTPLISIPRRVTRAKPEVHVSIWIKGLRLLQCRAFLRCAKRVVHASVWGAKIMCDQLHLPRYRPPPVPTKATEVDCAQQEISSTVDELRIHHCSTFQGLLYTDSIYICYESFPRNLPGIVLYDETVR